MEIPWGEIAVAILGPLVGLASKYAVDTFRSRRRRRSTEEIWILGPKCERLRRIVVKRSRKN
jgi:hypothetical protein